MKKIGTVIILILIFILLMWFFLMKKSRGTSSTPAILPNETPVAVSSPVLSVPVVSTPAVQAPLITVPVKMAAEPKSFPHSPSPVTHATPAPTPVPAPSIPAVVAPPVEIHKELIPRNIDIVRVYYAQTFMGPGSRVEFDINGSGFTKEFESMIQVESGSNDVGVKNLKLITPNQIHALLVVSSVAETSVVFPRVLIQGKVVFQAPEPFAVIRPGEVLNMVLMARDDSGRSARFRVITNLTQEQYSQFSITASSPSIQFVDMAPQLPYLIDTTVRIGQAPGGSYAVAVKVGNKTIWSKDGFINIQIPKEGDVGLIQAVRTDTPFFRPGDTATFEVFGSGFQPRDTNLISLKIPGLDNAKGSFSFTAPGRLALSLPIPADAPQKMYGMAFYQGQQKLFETPQSFAVVGANWMRRFSLKPPLMPGTESVLVLEGRDMDKNFISSLAMALDEPELTVTSLKWVSAKEAQATIKASANVIPGDYLISLTQNGNPVHAQEGNVVAVSPRQ